MNVYLSFEKYCNQSNNLKENYLNAIPKHGR